MNSSARHPVTTRPATGSTWLLLVTTVLLAGCQAAAPSPPVSGPPTRPTPAAASSASRAVRSAAPASVEAPTKVMVIAEENETYERVIGSGNAPYLDTLAHRFATATAMNAGYPTGCPSLAAYLLMTSGNRDGVCDDGPPAEHPIMGDNIFHQMTTSGREWRNYAESIPASCTRINTGNFLVRHAPAPYYVDESSRCRKWMLPVGTLTSGALHHDVAAGKLPAYSFVTPNACDDMHGGNGCGGGLISTGDQWLRGWMQQVMAGPDYRTGRLVVFITWDEGDSVSNHIPLLVVSPRIHHKVIKRAITQCDMLRTVEHILRVGSLGCAANATSLTADVGLASN